MTFSLIMPSYNQAHYIKSAIDSILEQDDPDWELWIVDNSTDATPEVVGQYTDPRIKFHHIPQRMDPGTCLNWALERIDSRDFSYVHTDNLLRPTYVRKMRQALAEAELTIAYCDLRSIDSDGHLTGVFRRGKFDLARLFSFSTLGVPFSATTALAKKIGGFNAKDVADDVVFCIRAFGEAKYVHIPDPIMDYRLHTGSRTTEHGGELQIERSFLRTFLRLQPEFEAKQISPLDAMLVKLEKFRLDLELKVEDLWYREGHRTGVAIDAPPSFQKLWGMGFLEIVCAPNRPVFSPRVETLNEKLVRKLKRRKKKPDPRSFIHSHTVYEESVRIRGLALPWVVMSVGTADKSVRCWLDSADVYTHWVGKMLAEICGWEILVEPENAASFPAYLELSVKPIPVAPNETDIAISIARANTYVRHLAKETKQPSV